MLLLLAATVVVKLAVVNDAAVLDPNKSDTTGLMLPVVRFRMAKGGLDGSRVVWLVVVSGAVAGTRGSVGGNGSNEDDIDAAAAMAVLDGASSLDPRASVGCIASAGDSW